MFLFIDIVKTIVQQIYFKFDYEIKFNYAALKNLRTVEWTLCVRTINI